VWNEKHTGLYNLLIVIVVSTNFRLALEVSEEEHCACLHVTTYISHYLVIVTW
jgi:hypothetical protein